MGIDAAAEGSVVEDPAPAEGKVRPEDTIETSWAWEIPVAPTKRSCT
jgi:hypothetical protein